jgi:O-antigen/teichoic acid export membrane protein
MWLGAASAAVAFSLAILMLRRHLPVELHATTPEMHPRIWWSSAIPMALTEGMRVLQSHLVILLMGLMATITMVGLFKVASSVALLIAVPVTLLNVVGAPVLARLHAQGDRARSQRLLRLIALGMTGSSLALTLPFLAAGQPLLSAVFGEDFGAANDALLVLCGSAVINGLFGANAALLNMTGHHTRVTRASGFSLVLLALASPPLITNGGILGAAIASALSMLAWNVFMWRDARRLLSLDTSVLHFFKNPRTHA